MPKIHIVTNDGEVVETIDVPRDMNLNKVYARMSLGADVVDAVQRARRKEKEDGEKAN